MSLQSPTSLRLLIFLAVLGTLAIIGANTAQAAADDPGTAIFPPIYLPLIAKNGQPGTQAPLITSTPPLSATTGILYSYDVNASGMPVPTFSLVVSPQGMTIDSISGFIQWTPTISGTYSVTVRAGNGIAPDAEQPFVIHAKDPPANPIITSTPPLSATAGISYTYDVNATGTPTPTYSLVITPQGMTIDRVSGLIQWTPAASGIYSVTVRASNGITPDADQPYEIQVGDLLVNPTITSTPPLTATAGISYTYDVNASGTPTPTYSLVITPQGMTIDSVSGLIQWTPTAGGNYSVTVRASNGIVPDAEQHFVVQVREWDPRLDQRGASLDEASVTSGQGYWRLIKAQWLDEDEAKEFGPDHHILVDVLDENGKRKVGVPIRFFNGGASIIRTQLKPGEPWAADFAMFAVAPAYSAKPVDAESVPPEDAVAADGVDGMGLGSLEAPDFTHHASYYLVWQWTVAP